MTAHEHDHPYWNPFARYAKERPKLWAAVIFAAGMAAYLATDDSTLTQKVIHKVGEFVALGVAVTIVNQYALKDAERQLVLHELDTRTKPMQAKLDLLDEHVQSTTQLTKWDPLESTCRHASLSIL